MSDTPKINLVLSDLEAEASSPEPFIVMLGRNKRVTFKDPYDFKISEREEILGLYERAQRGEADDMDVLKKLLSPADFVKYEEADLKIRLHERLVRKVMAHFEGGMGDAGNAPASASS